MVEYKYQNIELDLVFQALADSTRRDLLLRLKDTDQRVTDLASKYSVSLNAISKHLKVLEKANLIQRTVKGRTHYCRTNPQQLKHVEKWIEPYRKFWVQSLDNLDEYLKQKKESNMSEQRHSLRVEKILNAPPEMVFDAWLDQDNLGRWFMPAEGITVPNPKLDPVVGGKFDVTMKVGENILPHFGEFKKIDRATQLQFTWNSDHGTNGLDTLVTLSFEAVDGGKTNVVLVHELLPTEDQRDNHQGGWGRILDGLSQFAGQ